MSNVTKYIIRGGKRWKKLHIQRELWKRLKITAYVNALTGNLTVTLRNAGELVVFQELCNEQGLKYDTTS